MSRLLSLLWLSVCLTAYATSAAPVAMPSPNPRAPSPVTKGPLAPASPVGPRSNYSLLAFDALNDGVPNRILSLQTTATVPTLPPSMGWISAWPALDTVTPGGRTAEGNILHQPIIKWGNICNGPRDQYSSFKSWYAYPLWFSQEADSQPPGSRPNPHCHLGPDLLQVNPGDTLTMSINAVNYDGHTASWRQTVTDNRTGQSSTLGYDIPDPTLFPSRVNFDIEFTLDNNRQFTNQMSPLIFTNTAVTAADPLGSCNLRPGSQPTTEQNVSSTPVVSNDGRTCSWDQIAVYPIADYVP